VCLYVCVCTCARVYVCVCVCAAKGVRLSQRTLCKKEFGELYIVCVRAKRAHLDVHLFVDELPPHLLGIYYKSPQVA
jgi:hypothetical protein